MNHPIARVALPVPLDKTFDYLIKPNTTPIIGGRVLVSFGRQRLVGIVVAIGHDSDFPIQQLKPIQQVLDNQPLWQPALFSLLKWASSYYQYPLGDALANAMPALLRKGREASTTPLKYWHLTETGRDQPLNGLKRAPKQAQILNLLRHGPLSHENLLTHDVSSTTLKTVEQKGWISEQQHQPQRQRHHEQQPQRRRPRQQP